MVRSKRLIATLTFAFAVVLSPFANVSIASAATRTWDGGGSDNKFSTAANWSTDTVPVTGDALVFNSAPQLPNGTYEKILVNDLASSVRFSSVTVDGTALSSYGGAYRINGVVNLQANATLTKTGTNLGIYLNNGINGAGALSVTGSWYIAAPDAISGQLTLGGDASTSLGGVQSVMGVTSILLKGTADLSVDGDFSIPLTTEVGSTASLSAYPDYINSDTVPVTRTISGPMTLNADLTVRLEEKVTLNITGAITGGGHIIRNKYSDQSAVLMVNGQSITNQPTITTLDGVSTDSYFVVDKETAVLNGTRSSISVSGGGLLKGTGLLTSGLYINKGGTVAPGNSPGKITTQEELLLAAGSTYEAELLNKDSYDQLVVGQNYTGTFPAVQLTDAALKLSFLPGGIVNQGETFTIIDNQHTSAVEGTFAGLPEGGRITIGGAVFAISYVGGTGNDVVLTALTTAKAPGTPNTGFRIVMANPALVAVIGVAAAGALLLVKRRLTR
jgi:hypothetical protein